MNTEKRRAYQLDFLKSKQNIIIGSLEDFPLDAKQLQLLDQNNDLTFAYLESGLTSIVINFEINKQKYSLKKKRDEILVKNIDGQTSFLNEIQRRKELESLKQTNKVLKAGIVDTIYANLDEGIILSKYIDGNHISHYSKKQLRNLFSLLYELEMNGFFEWDLCRGNILSTDDGHHLLFDFGYMYRYNPLKEFNNEGVLYPKFYLVERFETRQYIDYLSKLSEDNRLSEYRILLKEKQLYLDRKISYLIEHHADGIIIDEYKTQNTHIHKVLSDNTLFEEEWIYHLYNMLTLEIEDDLSGKSCTLGTLKKVEKVIEVIDKHYEFLNKKMCFQELSSISKNIVIDHFNDKKTQVEKYLL
jgi:hypothetical protein